MASAVVRAFRCGQTGRRGDRRDREYPRWRKFGVRKAGAAWPGTTSSLAHSKPINSPSNAGTLHLSAAVTLGVKRLQYDRYTGLGMRQATLRFRTAATPFCGQYEHPGASAGAGRAITGAWIRPPRKQSWLGGRIDRPKDGIAGGRTNALSGARSVTRSGFVDWQAAFPRVYDHR
jgi:hypothetical protein